MLQLTFFPFPVGHPMSAGCRYLVSLGVASPCPKVVEPLRDCATWRSDVQFLSAILQLSILFMFNILGTACFMKVELSGTAASSNANNGVGATVEVGPLLKINNG